MRQRSIPCVFMRGGTSRGPYFLREHLPQDTALRDRVLLAVMGSPDVRQIDGLGGADPLTSKVAIVGASQRADADVDYLFAQVSIDKAIVDTEPSCGNMLAGIGPYAIEQGLVKAEAVETRVTIFNVNTQSRIEALVQTPDGHVEYDGDQAICGVPGTAAPVLLNFFDVAGAKTAALLPTGRLTERIGDVTVTCIDAAMPMVLLAAGDLGLSGYETERFASDAALMTRMEAIRREAGKRMGLGEVADKVIPKLALLAPPRAGGTITSRYFTPDRLHQAHAVTGAICVACATLMAGSVAAPLAGPDPSRKGHVRIEHPSGWLDLRLETEGAGAALEVQRAGIVRTARKIMQGQVFVPSPVWPE